MYKNINTGEKTYSLATALVYIGRNPPYIWAPPEAQIPQLLLDAGFYEYVEPEVVSPTDGEIRARAAILVKEIRSTTLDLFPKNSPGVLAVYDVNYEAARRYQANDTTPLKTGALPADYLSLLGAEMIPPMTAAAFAAYIIAENQRVGPTATEVEQMYLRYLGQVYTRPIAEVPGIVETYRAFCAPVGGA